MMINTSDYTIADIIQDRQEEIRTLMDQNYAWKCELHPSTYWHCEEGKQPNAFHRLMQRLCFGVKWSRIDD
jgi:hypothetical protein